MTEDVRAAVLKVALPHQIMSRYTSLVAIDRPVSRPAGEGMSTQPVPTNPPAGWTPAATCRCYKRSCGRWPAGW